MHKKSISILALVLILLPGKVTGQDSGLFLNQAILTAISKNPEIIAQTSAVEVSSIQELAVIDLINPFFTFDGDTDEKEYSFGLLQTVAPFGSRKARVNVIRTRNEIQKIRLNARVIEVREQVREAYTDFYISQEEVILLSETLEYFQELEQKALEAGEIDEVEDLLIKETLLNLISDLENTKFEGERLEFALEDLLGQDIKDEERLRSPLEFIEEEEGIHDAPNIDEMDVDALTSLAMENRPEVLENSKEQELAVNLKKLALANRWPLMILGVAATTDLATRKGGIVVSSDIELPIIDRETKEIEASEKRLENAIESLDVIKKDIKREVTNAYEEYNFSKNRILTFKDKYLPELKEIIDKIRKKYEEKEIPLSQLIIAENSRLRIIRSFFEALRDYEKSVADLEKATASNLTHNKIFNEKKEQDVLSEISLK